MKLILENISNLNTSLNEFQSWIENDGSILDRGKYISWGAGDVEITLDGTFTLFELFLICGWIVKTRVLLSLFSRNNQPHG